MDEFTFPNIAKDEDSTLCQLPFPHFAASPLWFFSSVGDDDTDNKTVDELKKDSDNKTDEGVLSLSNDSENAIGNEERMDMLWEDFNEELRGMKDSEAESDVDRHNTEEGCFVQALHMPTGRGGLLQHHKRPSLVMMLKVLKKLVLIQKAGSSKKTPLY